MEETLKKTVKIEEGGIYQLKTDKTSNKVKEIHIDKVYSSPCYTPHDGWVDNAEDMIVYRFWSESRERWFWYVATYWEFCIWNDFNYKK